MSWYGWKEKAVAENKIMFKQKKTKEEKAPDIFHHVHKLPVCAGLMKLSFDCATATTFAVFTDGAYDLRD